MTNGSITKSEMVYLIQERVGFAQKYVRQVLDAFEDISKKALLEDNEVFFKGFFRMYNIPLGYGELYPRAKFSKKLRSEIRKIDPNNFIRQHRDDTKSKMVQCRKDSQDGVYSKDIINITRYHEKRKKGKTKY